MGEAFAEEAQIIEVLGLGQLLRLGDALGEGLPGQNRLDGGEGVRARLLGVQQGAADARVQAHLVVDGLAGPLEPFGMAALGLAGQRGQEPVMQVDHLVDQRGAGLQQHGDQGGVAPDGFQVAEALGGHLAAFPRQFQQTVLVDDALQPLRKAEVTHGLQPLQMGQDVFRFGRPRRLAPPGQPAALAAFPDRQQSPQGQAVRFGQRPVQGRVDLARAAAQRLAAGPLDHAGGGQDDPLLPQPPDQGFGEREATVGLPRQLGQRGNRPAVIGPGEHPQVQPGLQFRQVLPAGLRALRIVRPQGRVEAQLAADERQQVRRRLALGGQGESRMAEVAELHGETQPVMGAAPPPDHREVGVGEGVMADEFVDGLGESQQAGALGRRQPTAAGHPQASARRYWYRVSRLMPNSRARAALDSPVWARRRSSAIRSSARAFRRPR